MSAGMTKPWIEVTTEALAAVPVQTGVYEVREAGGDVLDIGYAGSHAPFGLRSILAETTDKWRGTALEMRFEKHVQYQTRYVELVLNHRALNRGVLPEAVEAREPHVRGRLSPDTLTTYGE